MRPLRVVLVMIEPPLPFGNAAARSYYVLLKGLVARGHKVTAFAACSDPRQIDQARDLFPAPAYDLRPYLFPAAAKSPADRLRTLRAPFSYMFSAELRADLAATLAGGYDVLHLEQLWSAWLGLGHSDRALVSVHYLIGIDWQGVRPRLSRDWKTKVLGGYAERRLVRGARFLRTCTPRLEAAVRRLNPGADVTTVPFPIDPALYPYVPDGRRPAAPNVTLIGSMDWLPTRSAAFRLLNRLWPEVKARVPSATLRVVGWHARGALRDHLDRPDVEILENVADARPYFESGGVMLYAPGRGSGIKVKVQEAMAYGLPVVCNREGVEGLGVTEGVEAAVSDHNDGLVERTVALLNDPGRQNRQRRAARSLVESHCGPGPTLDALERVYGRIVSGSPDGIAPFRR